MTKLEEVRLSPQSYERFSGHVPRERFEEAAELAARMRERLDGRVVWNINSTARGGGVAEMLRYLVAYGRGIGVDSRWAVLEAPAEFFRITKRLHNSLHGSRGDGSPLGSEEKLAYERVMRDNATDLLAKVAARDVVILHDPQTAGLIPLLVDHGAIVIWRCHIGHDTTNAEVERGWAWLAPYLESAHKLVFSRQAYIPEYCDRGRSIIIPPSIDPFSPKNQDMDDEVIRSILVHTGIVEGPDGVDTRFVRDDGTPGRVEHAADIVRLGRAPTYEAPLVVQVSRWDHLKDPVGVLRGFVELCELPDLDDARLVLAGPNVVAVADDPEGAEVFEDVQDAWRKLPHAIRARVQLVSLPMHDVEENGAIVNALQRHAAVVVQKSLHEGFGLTVTEAMWKARPVVASAVGGIQDQIEHGVDGLLLDTPEDAKQFARLVHEVLVDHDLARKLSENARKTVSTRYLGLMSLLAYGKLIAELDDGTADSGRA